MNALRDMRLRLSSALLLAAATVVLPTAAAADPSDPVCIMPPEDYCSFIEGHVVNSPGYRECFRRATALQNSEYCNPIDWSLSAVKAD
ncbi:hypothetical protein [Brevundimonas sp.]|uniref:hypothetical protein n=1 Tax=Brevundimonas sp. TaxID=1871086 RepID=UPI003F6FCB50